MRHPKLDDGMSEWAYVPATQSYIHQSGDLLIWCGTNGLWFGQTRDIPRTHGPFNSPELVMRSLNEDKQLRRLLADSNREKKSGNVESR